MITLILKCFIGFGLVLLTALSAVPVPAQAQESAERAPLIESLESQLELSRHRQLVEQKQSQDTELTPFTTDGCSGGLSAGWRYFSETIDLLEENHGEAPPWESCCVSHDREYHRAGGRSLSAEESFAARLKADESLRRCVLDTGNERAPELFQQYGMSADEVEDVYVIIANLIYRAVRIGGIPCSGLPWRWGYGWPACK
jgi:hypothetical protein